MCCGDWDIPVDKATYEKYSLFPAERLGAVVAEFVQEFPDKTHDNLHACIHRKPDGACPFFGTDRLCAIQKEYGPNLLSSTCSIYPRSFSIVDRVLEGSLSLSCPEAARTVLLQEDSTNRQGDLLGGSFRTDNAFSLLHRPGLDEAFIPIRKLITDLIRDRSSPVWQRLLMIVSLCSRLDELPASSTEDAMQLIARYEAALGQGPFSELERLEPEIATRLGFAFALSDERCRATECGQRFRNVFWDFIQGIGSSSGECPNEDVRRFNVANRDYLEPFFLRFPFIQENYLLNYAYQHLFPFGRHGSDSFIPRSSLDEAVLLCIQFSWLMTLLTGVAGRYGREFNEDQVVATVQSFTRAVEHVPQILEDALALAKRRDLEKLAGLAKLLRT